MHNIWQGDFPYENTVEDGYRGTAPAGSFPSNGFGLYEMSGNVWEWVADYYQPEYYAISSKKNPQGPKSSFDPDEPLIVKRVQRGGSYMCADSYCISYRNSARGKGEEDTGTMHCGFRCVVSPKDLPNVRRMGGTP
jgi:formylglycine-generating enzyme required for sulfatase activity